MLHNNGLYVCENTIIVPFCVILYFDDLILWEGKSV